MYDIAIIGAGPAGLTAGIYARRAGKSAIIFEGTGIGGQIAQAGHVENYPAFSSISGIELSDAIFNQAQELGCDFAFDQVKTIEKTSEGFHIVCAYESHDAKAVIIATGAQCRHLNISGEEELIGQGVSYCAVCDGAFYRDKEVIVVGGGNSALEDALYLSTYCKTVYLVHRRDTFRADAAEVIKIEKKANIIPVMSATPVSVNAQERDGVRAFASLSVKDADGNQKDLAADGLFVAVGRVPNNTAFATLVKLDDAGYIEAGENCVTGTPGVYAAGDCRKKDIRQLTTAVADGTVSALAAIAYIEG